MIKVSPSLLAADYLHFDEAVDKVIASGADALHYDVMDGDSINKLVENALQQYVPRA